MNTYRLETTISKDGTISIKNLPFAAGDRVEVLVRSREYGQKYQKQYPLRGQPIRYIKPLDSVAESEWLVLK